MSQSIMAGMTLTDFITSIEIYLAEFLNDRCGFDKLGRPVLYSTFALVGNRSVKTLMEHMMQVGI